MTTEISQIAESLSTGLCPTAAIRSLAPHESGLYSWWGAAGCLPGIAGPANAESDELELLYVGIASDLRKRLVGNHLAPRSGSSTFRRSLAGLLMANEGWTTRRTSTRVVLVVESEAALTAWMEVHLFVGFVEHPEPETVESDVIALLQPPLNLAKNTQHPLRPVMMRARAAWHRSADS